MMLYKLVILLYLMLFISFCSNKNETNKDKVNLVNLDKINKKKISLTYKYFKSWDKKQNKPIKLISNIEKKNPNKYIKVGYNKKNQIVKINRYDNKKITIIRLFEYNDRDNLVNKTLIVRNAKLITYYDDVLKHKIEKEVFLLDKSSKLYNIVRKEFYNKKGLLTKEELYNETGRFMHNTFTYRKNLKVASKKTFRRDLRLQGSVGIENDIFLHTVETYNTNGKLAKKLFYNQEENQLGHWNKYIYQNNQTIVYSYNPKNKLIEKKVYDAKGKPIGGSIFDYKN